MIRLAETGGGGGTPLYQLKITLRDCQPPIWRRIIVRADMKLDQLHRIIQIVMGWTDSHLHQFVADGVCYGVPDREYEDSKMENEKRHSVADLAPALEARFAYEYDFGDNWKHEVALEKILPPDAAFKHPVCLAGANACPPEDCGGSYGYANFVDALADPKHEEHESMKEWIGGAWDAARFSLADVNARLKWVKA